MPKFRRLRVVPLFAFVAGLGVLFSATGCKPTAPPAPSGPPAAAISAMNQGVSLMGQYNYDGAVKAFEQVLQAEPELAEAKVNLAIARFNRARKEDRDIETSGELLDAVLKSDTNNVRALYFKGIVVQHLGQTEPAVECFEKVLRQRPEDGVAWYLLGMCKQRLGQKCEREMLKAVELRPYLGSAYYKLFQSLQAEGETEKARPYLEKFKQLRESPLNETIELPQYNQMGELALVRPLPAQSAPPVTPSTFALRPGGQPFAADKPLLYGVRTPSASASAAEPLVFGGTAIGDRGPDGSLNLILTSRSADGSGRLMRLQSRSQGGFAEATTGSGLESARGVLTCAMGDFDNDGKTDLFATGSGGNLLFRDQGDGTFADVTGQSGIAGPGGGARSALFLDADHDGDLDLLVCSASPSGNQLWNNNADGTFTNIAATAGIVCSNLPCAMALPGDLDGDRDTDLVILCEGQKAKVFLNDLLGRYHETDLGGLDVRGDLGGVLQDFNGDRRLDLLVLGGDPARLALFLGDGHARFQPAAGFSGVADAAASWGPARGFRIVDIDLDGDLDVALFSNEVHLLLNDGAGRFVLQPQLVKPQGSDVLLGAEFADFDGDYVPDLLCIEQGVKSQVRLLPGTLTPPSTALSLAPTGVRDRDKRTRSPASGFGVTLTVRAGLREQSRVMTGQAGGFNQSPLPVVFGLGGARQADYVHFAWSDGVAQVENALAAGQHHKVAELERKISSCPVLFAWNGSRFEFITDFAGIGGLGYFVAPGEYAQPQVLEHVKIEPDQLRARNGFYELRITEPMEETAYIDRLELVAIDHPADWRVFPDERLAVTGSAPSHELLVVEKAILPKTALNPQGQDCTERLARVDRIYAYEPELDRRFFGFCRPHTLELDFGGQLAGIAVNERLFLFISGYLEFPFSQTTYAAGQAKVGWEAIRIERWMPNGRWETIIPDAGAFGGMGRTMTVEMTSLLSSPDCRLRLTSNLEIYYDQVFLAKDAGGNRVTTHSLPPAQAELRRVGFPREFSPDGRMPLIYDYDLKDATAPFHVLRGAYTRYGEVRELLQAFDDAYVLVGPGDEIATKFDASRLLPPPPGMARSFILVSHAYCKDMDFYTAAAQTLEPMPFRGMSRYPYPSSEHFPDTEAHRRLRATYNTRIIE